MLYYETDVCINVGKGCNIVLYLFSHYKPHIARVLKFSSTCIYLYFQNFIRVSTCIYFLNCRVFTFITNLFKFVFLIIT